MSSRGYKIEPRVARGLVSRSRRVSWFASNLCDAKENMSTALPVLIEPQGLPTRRSSDLSPTDVEKQPEFGTDIKRVPSSDDGSDRSLIDK